MEGVGRPDVLRELRDEESGPHAATRGRARRDALALIVEENLLDAAFCFRFAPIEGVDGGVLHAGGETIRGPRLVPESGRLTALACAVATVGPGIERRVSTLFAERRMSLALALDGIGNELLMHVSRKMQDRMLALAAKHRLAMAGELRPGDPGLALGAHAPVLRLAGADRIGVALSAGHALTPLKSTSAVMGVGVDLPPATWSRCDDCRSRPSCKLVRAAATAPA